jgi:hypothetical protein
MASVSEDSAVLQAFCRRTTGRSRGLMWYSYVNQEDQPRTAVGIFAAPGFFAVASPYVI